MSARNVCKYLAIGICVVLGSTVLYGQTEDTATIEELYLSQDIDLQVARSQAMASDREMKVLALQTLRSMIDDGMADTIGPEITAILNVLATEGTARQVRTGTNTVVNNFPSIRRQAVELLWQVGGNGAEEAMMGVIREDPEPMVLAEAVYGLGMMELENPEEVADHFVLMLRRWNAMPSPDNNLAFATLLSVEKLAQQNLEVGANPELINALLGIASGNYIREVRLKSIDVISGLRDRN